MKHRHTHSAATAEERKTFIKWSSRYEIGIPEIDAQHKKLVGLCDSLYASAVTTDRIKQRTSLISTLKECVDYVAKHFSTEEMLMSSSGFAGLAEHKARHSEFAREVLDTAKALEANNYVGAMKFVKFLHEWILSHISYEDRSFAQCVKAYIERQDSSAQ